MPKRPDAKRKKADWSRATRPQDAKHKKKEEGRQFEDQAP